MQTDTKEMAYLNKTSAGNLHTTLGTLIVLLL